MRVNTVRPLLTSLIGLAALGEASLKSDLANELLERFVDAVECAGCQGLLVPTKGLALLGDDASPDVLATICKGLKVIEFCSSLQPSV